MGCKSLVYGANDNGQAIVDGTIINFGNIIRRFGCHCGMEGGNGVVSGQGYYNIDVNVAFGATSAGTAVITLYKDGTPISGAETTTSTVNTGVYSLTIPATIRQRCDCTSVITAIIRGATGEIINAAIRIEKV